MTAKRFAQRPVMGWFRASGWRAFVVPKRLRVELASDEKCELSPVWRLRSSWCRRRMALCPPATKTTGQPWPCRDARNERVRVPQYRVCHARQPPGLCHHAGLVRDDTGRVAVFFLTSLTKSARQFADLQRQWGESLALSPWVDVARRKAHSLQYGTYIAIGALDKAREANSFTARHLRLRAALDWLMAEQKVYKSGLAELEGIAVEGQAAFTLDICGFLQDKVVENAGGGHKAKEVADFASEVISLA